MSAFTAETLPGTGHDDVSHIEERLFDVSPHKPTKEAAVADPSGTGAEGEASEHVSKTSAAGDSKAAEEQVIAMEADMLSAADNKKKGKKGKGAGKGAVDPAPVAGAAAPAAVAVPVKVMKAMAVAVPVKAMKAMKVGTVMKKPGAAGGVLKKPAAAKSGIKICMKDIFKILRDIRHSSIRREAFLSRAYDRAETRAVKAGYVNPEMHQFCREQRDKAVELWNETA